MPAQSSILQTSRCTREVCELYIWVRGMIIFFLYLLLGWSEFKIVSSAPPPEGRCPLYQHFARSRHGKSLSAGQYSLPYQRPPKKCRVFTSQDLEQTIARLKTKIADPDLFRLFENAYPNTLDTAVLWTGFAWKNETGPGNTDEDLAFVITGDM